MNCSTSSEELVLNTSLAKKIHAVLYEKEAKQVDFQSLCIRISDHQHFIHPKAGKKSKEKQKNLKEDPAFLQSTIGKLAELRHKEQPLQKPQNIVNIFDEEEEFELDNSKRIIDPLKAVVAPQASPSQSLIDDPFSWKKDQSTINDLFTSEAYEEVAEDESSVRPSAKRNYRREGTEKKEEFNKVQKVMRDNYNQDI